jgi:hypothetical protein
MVAGNGGCGMGRIVIKILGWLTAGIVGSLLIGIVSALTVTALGPKVTLSGRLYNGPDTRLGAWDYGRVYAEGAWVGVDTKLSNQLRQSIISCRKEQALCHEAISEVKDTGHLMTYYEPKEIVKWDETTIQYVDDSALCTSYVYTIDRATKNISGIRTLKKNTDSDLCKSFQLEETIRLTLSNGYKISSDMQRSVISSVKPYSIAALAALWIFVIYRIFRIFRKSKKSPHPEPT